MPHQCTKCGEIYKDGCEELLKGCSCGCRFFFYIKQERLDELNEQAREVIIELNKSDKVQIEKDIREITGMSEEPDKPVILDLECVRVIKPGKFEIDIVNLFQKNRPLIYKLEEGKYIIDLSSSFKRTEEVDRKIRPPSNRYKLSEENSFYEEMEEELEESVSSDIDESETGKDDEEEEENGDEKIL